MELAPCGDEGRQVLVGMLNSIQEDGVSYREIKKQVGYVVKTFPNILLDVARILTEQATINARTAKDDTIAIRQQLKPFFVFGVLIGKSPQITSLMYSYFENSSFQPLPEELFRLDHDTVIYTFSGFDDNLVKEILITYLKYLSFNPKWFSAVWNWSELGRFISVHPNYDLRYLAACCLSIITRPTRHQHMSLMQDIIRDPQTLIDVQVKHSYIFKNTFRPLIETKAERADEFILAWGPSQSGYQFCSESLTKITNILLLKRDVSHESNHMKNKIEKAINKFVPVMSICDTISKIAYAASIGKPCLIRGPTGSGKTSILDYIAAHTNRIAPPAYVKVQVGDQIDSKSLVGSYVCTEIPGQFEWQPGPLVQAMAYGSWIVFEDIDSAPSELAQVIHSVIENGNLSCVSCCPIKMDSPHPDFRIFFTQRVKGPRLGFGFIERLCDIVDLPDMSSSDLKEILEKRYQFGPLRETILQLYGTAEKSLIELNASSATRVITLRDLFKFCDRISNRSIQANDGKYASSDLDALLADAIDCFVAFLPEGNNDPLVDELGSKGHMVSIAVELGQVLNKSPNETKSMLARFPELRDEGTTFTIGRAKLDAYKSSNDKIIESRSILAPIRQSLQLLEKVSLSVQSREPVLLVGETGVGKTTIVQHLANMMKIDLVVINLSQQSDSSDLLGGYRPVDMRDIVKPINENFVELFELTFDAKENQVFLETAESLYINSKKCSEWLVYLKMICRICTKGLEKPLSKDKLEKWGDLLSKVRKLTTRLSEDNSSPMALAFSEGTLLRAVRKGQWILLDEINLAEPDVLQCLLLILDSLKDSYVYMHSGCSTRDGPTFVHPNFRIFACMNPSTDIGKRDLPVGIRGRFTEFFLNDVDGPIDLRLIVSSYVKTCLKPPQIDKIVTFYREIRLRSKVLSDISGNSPVYSLRTLCRALVICSQNVCRNIEKSLLESLKITFLQQLNEFSVAQVLKLIEQTIFPGTSLEKISDIAIPMPQDNHQYIDVEGFWIQTSSQKKYEDENYILTKSVKRNLERLSRILCLGQRKLPILIQGDTSVGKTSLIKYLAKLSGNLCFRINNHEHTDLQEYVGRYVLKENGELHFQEGLLVTAMRKGYWVILDELNLAPCELLEALNRVLDDNRELFIPETRETVKAHSKFVLFATQNPPQEYAGRKLLSRAFRNRFIELHFDGIPHNELEEILQKRCKMAPQYAKKIVMVMKELQVFRRESGCFTGKNSFMTIRDLFRWGERYSCFKDTIDDRQLLDWDNFLAGEGLILLEGRVRTITEAETVKSIIEKVFKLKLDRNSVYAYNIPTSLSITPEFKHIHFTQEFKKLFVQLREALKYKEPVLLCGQTGCGKTTACQLYANISEQDLIVYNCHLNTESSDFIGNVRPGRSSDQTSRQLFPWHDGPLVQAMKKGAVFLMDEISLADDAVLERINSVLEPDRSITLTELNGDEVIADEKFRFVATMNPGGDYGKKELSPALRNRFTEIYCHNTMEISQIVSIIEKSLLPALLKPKIAPSLIKVMRQFLSIYYKGQDIISLRDVLSWTNFLNKTTNISQVIPLSIQEALINGACLVFFDQFGTCGHKSIHLDASTHVRDELMTKLRKITESKFGKQPVYDDKLQTGIQNATDFIKFGRFCLRKGPEPIDDSGRFVLDAPTVKANAEKLVRALQLNRPVLLEGDPGAGKTSIVAALARLTGHKLVRINLSEQTDVSDLFGSDLPDASSTNDDDAPRFCWHDGPMLKAIKESGWILLDEMNLASQSVLEGLNALFDHRGEVYIPELDKKFSVDRNSTRIFACQNPYSQGAARKGLPQSFLNRFTSIYVEHHQDEDLSIILTKLYPNLPLDLVEKMIEFNKQVSSMFQVQGYEFNLRDLIYWCDLMTKYVVGDDFKVHDLYEPDRFVQFVYIDRMRSLSDKNELCDLFEKLFGYPVYEPPYRDIKLGEYSFVMTRSVLPRKTRLPPHLSESCILKYQMPFIESLAKAIEFNKMPILVGETGVGKRSMAKILAGLTGNEINIVGANRDMDTVELLGSFEQKSLQREMVDLVDEAATLTTSLINSIPRRSQGDFWTRLYKHIWTTLYATSIRDLKLSKSDLMDAYRFQLAQMQELISKLQPLSISRTGRKFKELQCKIANLKRKVLFHSESTYSSGNFEWIDSVLIKSIRNGSWLMIENANLLNPATLDRLNSLVEPNGTLSLNEKGAGPGGIETIQPHPDFRLILTMNPEYGELSRAMRNRGVEIYVRTRFYYEDFLMLLNQNGFVPEESKACMTYCIMQTSYDSHEKITDEKPENDGSLLAYFGLNYLGVLAHQIRRGMNVDTILGDMLISFYHRKGHLENIVDETISSFVVNKMNEYRAKYVVDLNDDRYKWNNFRHDLVSLTGGDAIPAMLIREGRLLLEFSCPIATGLLKLDEMIESFDIVVTCTSVKIFLELSTHGDFDYRKMFIKDTFSPYPKILDIINNEVESLESECLALITNHMPNSELLPVTEMYVDTRNSQDLHYYLLSQNYQETLGREDLQNRWLLSLHRIALAMITDLVEENSLEIPGNTSLWALSEKVRNGEMLKDDLIRPHAEIATDLYDLLNGLLRVVSNRCFPNNLVAKMMARLFWIGHILCRLKKGQNKMELIALCNQIPMLWALTYQKVVIPIIEDCNLADLSYNNKRFSARIEHICDFLDVTITKPCKNEKKHYNKVLNLHAATTKRCESVSREIDKFFNTLLGRYTVKSQAFPVGTENTSALAASNLIWSNSVYVGPLYHAVDILLSVESTTDDSPEGLDRINAMLSEVKNLLVTKRNDYDNHEEAIKNNDHYRSNCLIVHRRRCALDQFAPVWQSKLIQMRFSKLHPDIGSHKANYYQTSLRKLLCNVNGLVLSPRYLSTLTKFLQVLARRPKLIELDASADESGYLEMSKIPRQNLDMYAAYLVDYLLENIILDNQIVGWIKMRVNTSDLSTSAPLIPEYSPIISLVSSYCLDISHLKLNSYQSSSPQLDSMLMYLWRAYAQIKFNPKNVDQNLSLARNLIHLRLKLDERSEVVGDYKCSDTSDCCCIDEFIHLRAPKFRETIDVIKEKADSEDASTFEKAVKLIYYGFHHLCEYAPLFTLDPSLRFREKMEVYTAELAHTKADLHQRNTLHYWKTGENLRLVDITTEEAKLYPMSIRVLVERREKLEKSLGKLRREFTNRPKSDDGSLYYELRKDVEISISRNSNNITSLVSDLLSYLSTKKPLHRSRKITSLTTKCRMLIKTFERTIARFKSDFILYSDLTTNYLLGSCFALQGMRLLYSRLEQKMQLINMGFTHGLVNRFSNDIMRLFSFNNFTMSNMESVSNKRALYPVLNAICPEDKVSYIQSLLLKSALIQLNHHIVMTPSDIQQCIPIVRNIADKFHKAWLERKTFIEEQRKKQEDLYQYRTSHTSIGNQISFERQEFIAICNKFPLYDHIYQDHINVPSTSADRENLETEEKIINMNRSVDLTMCIDVCKAHYKFMKEASLNLLGQHDTFASPIEVRNIDMNQLIKLEAEILYTVMRKCVPNFGSRFDSLSIECHLLQANQLIKMLRQRQSEQLQVGSLRGSIEILDEDIFDIYYSACPQEVLKFQELLTRVDEHVNLSRSMTATGYDTHPLLHKVTKLTSRISSFLITDPLMKFVTGAHTLLQQLEEWNKVSIRECRMIEEADKLIEIIHSWRAIEIKSWRSSLHRVKRKYIDDTLCDLWFRLHEAFDNPIGSATKLVIAKEMADEDFELSADDEVFYRLFCLLIKEFLEESTLGDYQIRLDLVFSFAIQTRFASLCKKPNESTDNGQSTEIDYDKLTTYVYNVYRQYQGLMGSVGQTLEREEAVLSTELNNEIRIVNWQGRNLWEIKNNFRISHRKLNKVMNRYLEVLKRRVPDLTTVKASRNPETAIEISHGSMKLSEIFDRSFNMITQIPEQISESTRLLSLKRAPKIIHTLKELSRQVHSSAKSRYVDVLKSIETTLDENSDLIQTFYRQRVEDLKIDPKDSNETHTKNLKACRQIYHSKKYAMQSIFKKLQELGVSYQRGLNNRELLDDSILSLEPLRGMVQNQSGSVLKAASEMIDDSLIITCNEMYRKMITKNQLLLAEERHSDLTSEQFERIHGCAYDIVLDIITHNRNAALIYRHLIDIHAATTRLQQLQNRSGDEQILVYKFSRVHNSVRKFNELVSRAFSSLSKLEMLMDCFQTYSDLQMFENEIKSPNSTVETTKERETLKEFIVESSEKYSLMTCEQHSHLQDNLVHIRKSIAEVSSELRDKLRHTIKNHLYGDDDIQHIQQLYDKFVSTLRQTLPEGSDNNINIRPGTILGSMSLLCVEAEKKLKPIIQTEYFTGKMDNISVDSHNNIEKLDIRLQKLLKQAKLAAQEVFKDELNFVNFKPTSESARRKMKPFNHIDSSRMRVLLRPLQVSKHVANCFMTLNIEDRCTNVKPIITQLAPILFIYTQDVGRYLNVILTSMHLKLLTATQLIPFFTDIVTNAFGMPYRIEDIENAGEEQSNGTSENDNVGFGEGQGDTDASNKIEFESQLDDLKKDNENNKEDDSQEADNGPSTENIEAHDDGIEMSEDFEAKPEGPGEKELAPEEEDEDVGEDEDVLKGLDKEFDDVEQDDENLDQNLWDDKDEPLGEDNEEDLREADIDQSTKPDLDEKDLMAKNADLKQSSAHDDAEAQSDNEDEGEPDMDSSDVQMNGCPDDDDDGVEEEYNENGENSEIPDDKHMDEEENIPEQQDETESSINVIDTSVEMSDVEQENSKEEANESNNNKSIDETMLTESEIDVDGDVDIDIDDTRDDIGETGQDSSKARGEAQDGGDDEDQDEELRKDDRSETAASDDKNVSTRKTSGDTDDQANPVDGNENDHDQDQEVEDLAGKRTFADRNSVDTQTLKRQKIDSAAPSDNREKPGDDSEHQQDNEAESVRHLEKDTYDAIEVVDLASNSDDDYLLDNGMPLDQMDQKQSTKPKDLDSKQGTMADKFQQDDSDPEKLEESTTRQQSTYNTNLGLLKYISHGANKENDQAEQDNSTANTSDLMEQIDTVLKECSNSEHESLATDRLTSLWLDCTRSTGHLVHELCQQLQIVLQPTKMSKYKGDYKSGKRLNMRKIISYIASHYRKDKIWLRRTKPCKRTYNISLAVDNSSSMSENNCRQMTYQSLALLAKALSLIEAGSLNVVSFGGQVKCIHEFDQPYVDAIGAQWLRELKFDESRTSYKTLLKHSCESFAKQAQSSAHQQLSADQRTSVHQLLVIISDGRNVTSESEEVKRHLRQLKSMGVLTLFVVIDDLKQNSGKSIVDVKSCTKIGGTMIVENYMDSFPFPFYVLLRQLDTMPSILGDALRQWFELVSNGF